MKFVIFFSTILTCLSMLLSKDWSDPYMAIRAEKVKRRNSHYFEETIRRQVRKEEAEKKKEEKPKNKNTKKIHKQKTKAKGKKINITN